MSTRRGTWHGAPRVAHKKHRGLARKEKFRLGKLKFHDIPMAHGHVVVFGVSPPLRNAMGIIHPRTPVLSFAVTLLRGISAFNQTNFGFLPPTRSQPRLGLVGRCGDLAL